MSIVEAVKAKRLATVKKQIVGAENFENSIKKQAVIADIVLSGEDDDLAEARKLQRLYYEYYNKYTHKKSIPPSLETPRAQTYWKSVAAAVVQSQVPAEEYISAQFSWFDKNFGTAPQLKNLRTEAAVIRAQEAANIAPKKVVAKYTAAVGNFADTMRMADQMLRDVCKAQKMTRQEVYRNLVIPGLLSMPESFLKADPEFAKAKESLNDRR